MKPLDSYQLLAVGQQLAVVLLLEELQLLPSVVEQLEGLRLLLEARQRQVLVQLGLAFFSFCFLIRKIKSLVTKRFSSVNLYIVG
jgi:hypothetical protein